MFNNYHFGLFYFFCDVTFYLCAGNEDGGGQLVYESACCLAWGAIFDRRKDSGVVCEFPAQKCRSIENRSHETGSLSEKVHGCHILP